MLDSAVKCRRFRVHEVSLFCSAERIFSQKSLRGNRLAAKGQRMKTFFKFFVVRDNDYVLGPGRIHLLRLVDELGSLRKAAREMDMSYRWAWGRIRKAEEALGVPLLEQDESSKKPTKVLTRDAREIITWFLRTEAELANVLKQAEQTQPRVLKDES